MSESSGIKVSLLGIDGSKKEELELPYVFSTPVRKDLIHRVAILQESHGFQKQGRYKNAGMDVSAASLDPPTGHGRSRIAKIRGGGGPRQGQAAGRASVRGGRPAHPPKTETKTYKELNKKENKFALCSAVAATKELALVKERGHKTEGIESLPIIVSNDLEGIKTAKELYKVLQSLKASQDVDRLYSRIDKRRTGKSRLRGRKTKVGRSVLLVVKDPKSAVKKSSGSLLGVDVVAAKDLAVLDLAPGAQPARLVIYTKGAIEEISNKVKSPYLELKSIIGKAAEAKVASV